MAFSRGKKKILSRTTLNMAGVKESSNVLFMVVLARDGALDDDVGGFEGGMGFRTTDRNSMRERRGRNKRGG
ncbi:hypothetical protein V500_05392 [Pseudogymnoascus sp. VKM F-4518 (FW-2643)]|nr:hypothetical protein V500_05392 [Pseudogymnoascus sp. VKM F-4518 (FW-2643)]KFZ09648.1 hypothetical protein V502_08589 [Pseudogymnoascus sp. VKM F-4520 (FW-2644)]